jgi:hypothetical protein
MEHFLKRPWNDHRYTSGESKLLPSKHQYIPLDDFYSHSTLHLPKKKKKNWTPWSESASELCRPSDCRLSEKLVPTFADRGCHEVNITDPHDRILAFLDRSRYYFFQVAPQLYSWGWVDPVPDPLLLRKSGNGGKRTRDLWICSQELWPLDHRGKFTMLQIERRNYYSGLALIK